MSEQNLNKLVEEVERRYKKKEKRKIRSMKVSGAGVKKLQQLIKKKAV